MGGATIRYLLSFLLDCISIHAPRGGSDSASALAQRSAVHFNPRSPWGERLQFYGLNFAASRFQSTLPVGGATPHAVQPLQRKGHFNPRSPWGERPIQAQNPSICSNFNPRSPWGERPDILPRINWIHLFQSTLPVGGATVNAEDFPRGLVISIHAPRGGSDRHGATKRRELYDFNPRSPWGERLLTDVGILGRTDFNPRSPWGERPVRDLNQVDKIGFQSTLPVGGATSAELGEQAAQVISIHAPRGGSDRAGTRWRREPQHFNPRSPWGERLGTGMYQGVVWKFQSTLPVGGATTGRRSVTVPSEDFNPRSPWGERHDGDPQPQGRGRISIHAPRGGSDDYYSAVCRLFRNFNPRSPWGERL